MKIRDNIRDVMAERGHSIRQAAKTMGVPYSRLHDFMNEGTLTFGDRYGQLLADYLDLPWYAVNRWMIRDAYHITEKRKAAAGDGLVDGEVVTWMGTVGERVEPESNGRCDRCDVLTVCRAEVNAGRSLPCEQFLERDVITPEMRFRVGARSPRVGSYAEMAQG